MDLCALARAGYGSYTTLATLDSSDILDLLEYHQIAAAAQWWANKSGGAQ